MANSNNTILNFIKFSLLYTWDCKRYFDTQIQSKYVVERLEKHIIEETEKIKPFDCPDDDFYILGVANDKGMFDAYVEKGKNIKQAYKKVKDGVIAYNPYRVNVGSIGIKTKKLKHNLISPAYVVFSCRDTVLPEYIFLLMKTNVFNKLIRDNTTGSVRQTLSFERLKDILIPVPSLSEQKKLVEKYNQQMQQAEKCEKKIIDKENDIENYLFDVLGISFKQSEKVKPLLQLVSFSELNKWGYEKNIVSFPFVFSKYKAFSLEQRSDWVKEFYRGKSPKYNSNSDIKILNQKCNRNNKIILDYAKTVDAKWFSDIPLTILTKQNDIIINSTGEGTIGRASCVTENCHIGLIYDSHVLMLRVNQNMIDPQLFVTLFNSSFGQEQVKMFKGAEATKQTELGIENTKRFLFPFPDIEEQHKIVKEIQNKEKIINILALEEKQLRQQAQQEFEEVVFNET